MWREFFKPMLDYILALVLLVTLSPIIIIIYLLVWLFLDKSVIFKQPRAGLNGKIFNVYKFKTMIDKRDAHGKLLSDKERLTKFGRFLRASSLDELPQLCNILKGDMSFIGPRPLLVDYLPLYNAEQRRRHLVKPGITGWAQVNGRNAISWEKKFELDCWYVDNQSVTIDAKIAWLTVVKVFSRSGINQADQTTMEKFSGTK